MRYDEMTETDPDPQPVVLVAEDEELIRLWAADVLQESGFSVLEASNAEGALRVLEARPEVRLLFTDIHMPGAFDGMELARRVHDRWPHVQLVVTSGKIAPRPAEIPDDGRFLAKPYRAEQLVWHVQELLRN
jgi:two-component system, response regulator PdtaR